MDKPKQEIVIASANAPELNSRRDFMKKTGAILGAAGIMSMVPMGTRSAAWAAGSDAPELKEVNVGFIPLTDCASVVIASVMKFDEKYGIKINASKEASWAAVRDKMVNGELHAAHVLYGLVYGVHLGIGGQKKDMSVLMTLNNNGQAITLSNQLKDKGATTGATLKKLVDSEKRDYTFAQTFPTGTHAMWLYYWLASYGINPLSDVKTITVPPPQMVANMRIGNMDGFCVGEPWNNRAIYDKIGFTAATTQDIWKDHPEKVLGCTAEFAQKYPNTARALIMAVLEASKYIDDDGQPPQGGRDHRRQVVCELPGRCDRPASGGQIRRRPGQEVERPQLHEVLQRRRGELPLPVGRHVVPHAAQALGPAQGRSGLSGRGQADQPDRAV